MRKLLAIGLALVLAASVVSEAAQAAEPEHVHVVYAGQRLGSIAKRYNVTIEALCEANGISRRDKLHPGDKLIIPGRGGPTVAASSRVVKRASWKDYVKRPARRGYVKLLGYDKSWQGYVLGARGRLIPAARRGVSRVLSAPDKQPIHPRLIELLARVSDRFGGRPLFIVSGFRTKSWFKTSRHKLGNAVDFSVIGVPNEAVRDYLRTLPKVGVGYYPNSSFLHLDVREVATYWIDRAGPGQPPQLHAQSADGSASDADD